MGGSKLFQLFTDGGFGELGAVAILAQVGEIDVFQLVAHDFRQRGGGGFVAQMAVSAADPLLHGPRTMRVVLQEFQIVVGFEDQRVGLLRPVERKMGCVAEVGEEDHVTVAMVDEETDGIRGVMRDGERFHIEIAHGEALAGFKKAPVERARFSSGGGALQFRRSEHGFTRGAVGEDGDAVARRHHAQSLHVVAVLVRDEDAIEILDIETDGGEPFLDLLAAETCVHEEAGGVRLDAGAIATASAGENSETTRHMGNLIQNRPERKVGLRFF